MGVMAGLGVMNVAVGAVKAGADAKSSQNQQRMGDFQSAQVRQNAGQAMAASQRDAIDVDRQTQLNASRALAVAASDGGASDPSVINLIAQNASDGAYRKAVALFQGDDTGRSMRMQAASIDAGTALEQAQSKSRQRAMPVDSVAGAASSYARGTSIRSKHA